MQKLLGFFLSIFLNRSWRSDTTLIMTLVATTLIVLVVSYSQNNAMFFFDPYTFFAQALNVSQGSSFTYNPYIFFISLLVRLYPNSDALLLLVRAVNLIFAAQLIVFIYLVARKMFNQVFSVVAAMMALFLPLVHAYALQLHNDIFAAAMGFTAIYFLTRKRLGSVFIGIIFILIACATRPDYTVIFALPVALTIASYYTSGMLFRSKLIASLMVIFLILGIGYIIFEDYYRSTTRFGILERIFLFSQYSLVVTVWQNLISITTEDILNISYAIVTIVGIFLLIISNHQRLSKMIRLKNFEPTESDKIAVFLTACFFISFISISIFHTEYTIVSDQIIINHSIGLRYHIPIQLFFIFGFVYSISNYSYGNLITIKDYILSLNKSKRLSHST